MNNSNFNLFSKTTENKIFPKSFPGLSYRRRGFWNSVLRWFKRGYVRIDCEGQTEHYNCCRDRLLEIAVFVRSNSSLNHIFILNYDNRRTGSDSTLKINHTIGWDIGYYYDWSSVGEKKKIIRWSIIRRGPLPSPPPLLFLLRYNIIFLINNQPYNYISWVYTELTRHF